MDFIDGEAVASSDNVLVPSSQDNTDLLPRPRKRRRVGSFPSLSDDDSDSASHSDQYDLPSNDTEDNQNDLSGNKPAPKESLLHQQMMAEAQKNVFVTQLDQPWSSPTRIRGPRWRKKSPTPPSPLQVVTTQIERGDRSSDELTRPGLPPGSALPDEFDDDELEALMADRDLENNMIEIPETTAPHASSVRGQPKSLKQTTLFGMNTSQRGRPSSSTQARSHNWPLVSRQEAPSHHEMKLEAMKTWVYPLNVGTIRDYQYNIVHKALFNNLLVALPTGLGKTFIAATVMLNWFNWTRDSQIVFMAPTKPLVAQQINACFHIAGIPRSQTTMLTGEVSAQIRAEEWQEKRVFFLTPQTFINDLKNGIADPKKIVLLVIDEAHKATGNFSYVEVVRFLRRFNSSFRVLALTATPGATVEAVQKVIDALDIARVEIRTEDSLDIRAFVHSRNTELEIFDYSEEMTMCLELFGASIKPVMDKLCSQNAYWSKDPTAITLYGLMQARKQWITSEAGRKANQGLKSMIHACFTPLMSLAHNLELLKYHGIGPFFHKMKIFEQEAGSGKYVKMITGHADFKKLMNRLKSWINSEDFVGHPKLAYLNTVVLNHFMDAGDGHGRASGRPPSDTRIMIFAHYRDSAEEITRILNRHAPMIRAHIFVGQSGTKGSEGMNQKTQLDIIQKFKSGTYNTLVATSIGEEGLDIGEIDLIVCYDCSKSPIRMLQRMGRTGRKRAGNIVVLLMRGKEERDYYSAKDNYRKIQEIIETGREFEFHDDRSPRIVPREIVPVVDKRVVEIPVENTQADSLEPRKRKAKSSKRPPKKFHMPDGVDTGFRFLGTGKAAAQKKDKMIDRTLATLPDLGKVLLSDNQESELNDKYAQIAGNEPQFVHVVHLESHPEKLYERDRTELVRHSRVTKRLLEASKVMRRKNRKWDRPIISEIMASFPSEPIIGEDVEQRRLKKTTHKTRKKCTTILSDETGYENTEEDDYDVNDSFVDDEDVDTELCGQLPGNATSHASQQGGAGQVIAAQPFYISQGDSQQSDHDLDLPEMGEMFKQSKSSLMAREGKMKKRGRHPIISDDEEDE